MFDSVWLKGARGLAAAFGLVLALGACSNSTTSTSTIPAPVANAGTSQSAAVGAVITLDGTASSDPSGRSLTYSWTLQTKPAGSNATLSSATVVSPSFTADVAGTYIAVLKVNNGISDSPGSEVTITVASAANSPVANPGVDQNVLTGSVVMLDGTASTAPTGQSLTFAWTLTSKPSGSNAALSSTASAQPTFTADVSGTYNFSLVVTSDSVASVPQTVVVTATTGNVAPVARQLLPVQNVKVGTIVTVNGSSSTDANGDALTYSWALTTVPSGSSAKLSSTTSVAPTFTADVAGTFVATLTVSDGKLTSAPVASTITAGTGNVAPVAIAGKNQSVVAGSTVTLDGSGSTDANGDPLTYAWALTAQPPASTAVLNNATVVNPNFTADVPGTYVAQLTVNDGKLSSVTTTDSTVVITVSSANAAPVANAGVAQSVVAGTTVTLDGQASSDANGDALNYAWTFTAKPTGSTATISTGDGAQPTFVADVAGIYTVQLIVNDGQVNSEPSATTIRVGQPVTGTLTTSEWTTAVPFYQLTGTVTIPPGVVLTVDGGTTVNGAGQAIVVQGTLNVQGTTSDLVSLSKVFIVPAGSASSNHRIAIAGATISGGNPYFPSTNIAAPVGSFVLTDSTLTATSSEIFLVNPVGSSVIERNVFSGSFGIEYGVNGSTLSLSIQNNVFENWLGGFAVENLAVSGSGTVTVAHNSFLTTNLVAVELGTSSSAALDAANNFWGTTDTTTIQAMIKDHTTDPSIVNTINYQPFLTTPDPATPLP